MSQNSRHCLLPIPHSESDPLKQAPPPPVDVVVPVLGEGLTQRVIVQWPCLVFHNWRLCQRSKRWILYSAACPLHYRVPYHPSKQIFDGDRGFVLQWDHSGSTLLMCSISLLSCFTLFVSRWQSTPHCIYCSYMAEALNCPFFFYLRCDAFFILISFKTMMCSLWTAWQASCRAVIFIKPNEPPYTPGI